MKETNNELNSINPLWNIALNGAKYMVENCSYDYDSGSMDAFLLSLGLDIRNDKEFSNFYYENMPKVLGWE